MSRPKIISLMIWISKITIRSMIPPLPRMFSSHYDSIDPESERVMVRYGIRSPSGIKRAMKKYNVNTVDELAKVLEHHQAKRQIQKRFNDGMRRAIGGTANNPHRDQIRRAFSTRNRSEKEIIKERIRRLKS